MLGLVELGVKLPAGSRSDALGVTSAEALLVAVAVVAVMLPVPRPCAREVPLPGGPSGGPPLAMKEGRPVPIGADGVVSAGVEDGTPGTVEGRQTTFGEPGAGPAVTVMVDAGAVTVTVAVRKGMLTRKPAAAEEVD